MGNQKQAHKELKAAYLARRQVGGVYAIRNDHSGKLLLLSTTDLQGCGNRFKFAQMTGSCTYSHLQRDWGTGEGFSLLILEELERGETQTDQEFAQDIRALEEMWREKYRPEELY